MKQDLNFRISQINSNEIRFTVDKITITIDRFFYENGKHQIATPQAANAQFVCCGSKYIVENTDGVNTVEDWYTDELLPKMQMLSMLLAN